MTAHPKLIRFVWRSMLHSTHICMLFSTVCEWSMSPHDFRCRSVARFAQPWTQQEIKNCTRNKHLRKMHAGVCRWQVCTRLNSFDLPSTASNTWFCTPDSLFVGSNVVSSAQPNSCVGSWVALGETIVEGSTFSSQCNICRRTWICWASPLDVPRAVSLWYAGRGTCEPRRHPWSYSCKQQHLNEKNVTTSSDFASSWQPLILVARPDTSTGTLIVNMSVMSALHKQSIFPIATSSAVIAKSITEKPPYNTYS